MGKFQDMMGKIKDKWNETDDFRSKSGEATGKTIYMMRNIGSWAYKLRSVLLAIPVAVIAVVQAVGNARDLPEIVGLDLQATGEFAILLDRGVAVMGPLAVTAVCLLMMFCSRRVFFPWLISLFSLVLPAFLLYSNTLLR